ncbi:Rossmann-fold NAD(P)-binding domain-containing protein [Aquibacillus rhizosphaerae]|uniref:NAD(P)-binding domain-containing protein n=1 Tax=Aquibacillus rhizosphaerae TaxID=3051431 RepID=A0ABT7LC06_9BACI|nr:hypothetical protein [Aquibacillus sp. LR5S19]MDL4842110.1 hypothetical protein [Aquibacillus sp. LR5S19]
MGKLLLTGIDGNLGKQAADYLLEIVDKEQVIFCGYDPTALKEYAEQGIETHETNFNTMDGLVDAFAGADKLALISMPFVGEKRNMHTKM